MPMSELNREQKKEVKEEVNKQVEIAKEKLEKDVEKKVEKRIYHELVDKATRHVNLFGIEFKQQTAAAIIAAFGFLIALAWKDLIVKIVEQFTAANLLEQHPYLADLVSAFIVTAISVVGIVIISKWAKK